MNKAKPIMLRWPEGLRQSVVDAAARNRRSINSEILNLIELGISATKKEERAA